MTETHGTLIDIVKHWCAANNCEWLGVGRGSGKLARLRGNPSVWKVAVRVLPGGPQLHVEGFTQDDICPELDLALTTWRRDPRKTFTWRLDCYTLTVPTEPYEHPQATIRRWFPEATRLKPESMFDCWLFDAPAREDVPGAFTVLGEGSVSP